MRDGDSMSRALAPSTTTSAAAFWACHAYLESDARAPLLVLHQRSGSCR